MSAYVFAGPSLPASDRHEIAELHYLPPVAQGDLLPLIEQGTKVIGIIDGFFEAVPSVLHKEILYAISRGVIVVGGASMGALRAAELSQFGMIGIGPIYEAYAQGRIEDDDEVAVLHGPAEMNYLALSDAMVDIRSTLEAAARAAVINELECAQLAALAKKRHYRERRFDQMLRDSQENDELRSCIAGLEEWLPKGRIPQKQRDAQAVLQEVRRQHEFGQSVEVDWHLQWTDAFDLAVHDASLKRKSVSEIGRGVIDELKLRPKDFEQVRDRALLRGLANKRPHSLNTRSGLNQEETLFAIFAEHGLLTAADQRAWLEKQQIDEASISRLVEEHRRLIDMRENPPDWFWPEVISELRLSGAYADLAERAEQKRAVQATRAPILETTPAHSVLKASLIERFLQDHGGKRALIDQEKAIRQLGFADRAELGRFLLNNHLYRRSITPSG